MLAIKKLAPGVGLTLIRDEPRPEIGPRDVLIAVTHAGICGTDRHIYEWDDWSANRIRPPITLGHEFVGRVAAVGEAVQGVEVGQRVSAEGHIGCGVCEPCRTGAGHICDKVDIIGIDRNGAFAQFVAVPEENIWPIDDEIPDEIAAILDPLGNAVHTVMAAGVSGHTVLVTGVGTIGLMAIAVARRAGASKILATDINPAHLEMARRFGADATYLADDPDWPKQARAATQNQGPHVLLEMSGHPLAIRQGFAALGNGGTAALLGLPAKEVAFDLATDIIFKGAKVLGINGRLMFKTWYQMESLLLAGLDVSPLITHRLELADFDRGFKLMQSGEAIKVVLSVPPFEES